MPAILFGSISTIADTSELQRESFNAAFREHGLDWNWSREVYVPLLESNGGAQRVVDYARAQGQDVDAAAVHRTKSELFQRTVVRSGAQARPGVVETIKAAKAEGVKVALVTTTPRENIIALLDGVDDLSAEDFDLITDLSTVEASKPDPAVYAFALDDLGEDPAATVAIEDNVGGMQSAQAAGIRTIAFPNQNTAGQDFGPADERVERLDAERVRSRIAAS